MMNIQNAARKKNIVILGGGFAGITAALRLSKKLKKHGLNEFYTLILVNDSAHHLFTPALYEIASIPKREASASELKTAVCIPIETIIAGASIVFLEERATLINRFSKTIYFSETLALNYEYLLIATGAQTSTYGIPGIAEFGFSLKTFTDAVRLRNKIDELVQTKREIRILVAGAGPTGIELVAESHNYLCYLQERASQAMRCDAHLELIEAGEAILPGFPQKTMTIVEKRLRAHGINIRTHARIIRITDREAHLEDGTRIRFDLFVWSGGVMGAPILKTLNVPLTKKGNVPVNEFLQLPLDPSIFVVGDSASFLLPTMKRPLPWNVPVAEAEGRLAAKNILRNILKKPLIPYRPPSAYPYVLTVGRTFAVADLQFVRFSGFAAWLIKQLIELRYFLSILPLRTAFRLWFRMVRYVRSND